MQRLFQPEQIMFPKNRVPATKPITKSGWHSWPAMPLLFLGQHLMGFSNQRCEAHPEDLPVSLQNPTAASQTFMSSNSFLSFRLLEPKMVKLSICRK